MTRQLVLVNASPLLEDAEVQALVPALQLQIDRDFMPAWRQWIDDTIKVSFAGIHDIPSLSPESWPIFLNKHSTDPGALGWHDDDPTQNIRTYSRVYVGDCLRAGLNWETTISHEALELIVDPNVKRVWRMPNGRLAAMEVCDAVEADDIAYDIGGHKMSDFVLPIYFSASRSRRIFDFRSHLHAPCPALTPGGYMPVTDARGDWTQVQMDRSDGLAGRRALGTGYRRQARARLLPSELEPVTVAVV